MNALTGYTQAGKGFLWLLGGVITSILIYWGLPPIVNFMLGGDANQAVNFLITLIYIFILIILPNWKTWEGIAQIREQRSNVMIGMMWTIATLLLLWMGYWIIPSLANLFDETILVVFFYSGTIINITLQLIGVGVYSIIKGLRN